MRRLPLGKPFFCYIFVNIFVSYFIAAMEQKRLFLLDAYALIFRAYYALIRMPRITQSGFNTSAIFGFVNTLEEVLRKENPSHIAVCFDPAGPTFRNEAFEQYKGERESTPEDIKLSVPIIKEIVKAYNIPVVEVAGYEADDVIGTLARRAEKENFTTYMMTPDKDRSACKSFDSAIQTIIPRSGFRNTRRKRGMRTLWNQTHFAGD